MGWLLMCLHLLLFNLPSFSSSFNFSCHHDEYYALLQFKSSFTIGASYFMDETYIPKTTTWKNKTDCCSWQGVTCDIISGHVTGINLSDESLQGEVPTQISHLSKLESLNLALNEELVWKEIALKRLMQNATNLRHVIFDSTNMSLINSNSMNLIFKKSPSLVTLRLKDTKLSGNFKNNIFCLLSIQELDLSNNRELFGQLPKFNCSASLKILDLSWCRFQGSIPLSYSNLTHLTSLDLSLNHLNGSIPSSLINLPHLTTLYLNDNDLNGQIPNEFPLTNKFQLLNLGHNNIKGEMPSSLSNLQHLTHMDFSHNSFGGQIPDVFGGMTELITLDCSYNKLEGPILKKYTGCQKLIGLSLNDNLLNGTIPSWLLSLPNLVTLYLSNNRLTGPVSSISSYSLEILSLRGNNLRGNISASIFGLANLTTLDLSSNNFSGIVDFQRFSKLQNLNYLSLSHNSQISLNLELNSSSSFSLLTNLHLSSLSLTRFPELLGEFPSLYDLDLSNNKLNGKVPSWLFETVDSLRVLNLSQNFFTSINKFSRNDYTYNLNDLDLSYNLLDGNLDVSICNMSSLGRLTMSHNKLTGTIPQCLLSLSSLEILDLQMNKFHGTLPSFFSNSNNLYTLNLFGNNLEGCLPKSLSNYTYLEFLNLGSNRFEDNFPDGLQSLEYLKVLVLRDNKLHGPIANLKMKHAFSSLVIFDISGNNFSGLLPKSYLGNYEAMKIVTNVGGNRSLLYVEDSIGSYDSVMVTNKRINMTLVKIPTNFVVIDFSRNKFEGEIPNVVGDLYALIGLNLSYNRLTGLIPRSLGNLTNLESLDLSSNMLTGVIPLELTNLNSLEVLDLSRNHLTGEIPQGKQFNTFSNDSYENNLGLCGFPLSKKCGPEQNSPPSPDKFWSEEKFGFGWKPVAIGYGCGFVLGIGLGYGVFLIGKPRWLVMIFGGKLKRRVKRRTRVQSINGPTMNQMVQMS